MTEQTTHNFKQKILSFLRGETVLCVAVVLALASMIAVPPGPGYAGYIDWDTLAMLFSLMAVMKGFQKLGLFTYLGNRLLKRTATSRRMVFVLVFLPFVLSMVITNDVSLITFVPFGLIVLRMIGQEKLAVPLVVLQTVAANLGSMMTPMGNPQNLYLYAKSGMTFGQLCGLMLPYVVASAICLVVLVSFTKSVPVHGVAVETGLGKPKALVCCAIGFGLCLLGIFNIIPPLAIAAVTLVFLLFADRKLLASVDYSLLGTFVAFFIFVGNLGNISIFQNFLASLLKHNVVLVSVLASQVTSNVPAALLLSGFPDHWRDLIVGCNLGGLGTLIASMASLISYKFVVKDYPEQKRHYLLWFTLCNVALLAVLVGLDFLLKAIG